MGFQIAIDGPSGSGKSTVAKSLAERLGMKYVDTGAMYRGIGYYFIKNGIELNQEEINKNIENINLEIIYDGDIQKTYINGEDVTETIRTQVIADSASKVAVNKRVREKLVSIQQKIGEAYDVIMDGRDISSNVLKNADLKIYLDASSHVRTLRRINELEKKNISCNYDTIKKEIEERDYRDKNREIQPLIKTEDAVYLDSSNLSEIEVLKKIMSYIDEK